jgi:P-type Ca2+ transporter type 2C
MWFKRGINDVIEDLYTDSVSGLTEEEVSKRRAKYGYNMLAAEKQKSMFILFFEQLNDLLIYILIGAAAVSAFLGETSDAFIIGIVILINAVVGVIQEAKAEKALEALKKLSTPKALVKREGKVCEIPSVEIVPGDIVLIDAGRYIPCDLRLIETANLKIEESALTGESIPSEKECKLVFHDDNIPLGDQRNMAFMSTLASYGRGVGVAVGTGMNTEIGKIANMLSSTLRESTPLQKKLEELGKLLGIISIGICGVMFIVAVFQQRDVFEMFLTAISLAVAAIPEGLPAIVTIVLAMGVQRMIKHNAIVRKLPAVETLGAVNVICSDKTGTLTQNKMTVTKFYADRKICSIDDLDKNSLVQRLLIENILLCNDASLSKELKAGDPTEIALLEMGEKCGIFKDSLEKQHPRKDELPFDSDRKLMTTVNRYDDKYFVMTKGALDSLIKFSNRAYLNGQLVELTDEMRSDIINASNVMSSSALRVLGSAYKILDLNDISHDSLEQDLIFIGLVGMIDPPREEVKDSIKLCEMSGIKTVMITGDHKNTALAIAKELNIATAELQAISGTELDDLSDEEFISQIDNLRVFARVSPEHKVRIVKALKSRGNIVSMTGDGVNDAPSLKTADIGVAMGMSGTDVAKGASDIILTDDKFSTIVKAIEEGRNIFNNIKKSIVFLLSCNTGEIIALFTAILLGWAPPLKPIHILWVNLITDTLPALALGIDTGDPDVMKEKPRNTKESLFAGSTGKFLIFNGLLIGALTLAAFVTGNLLYPGSLMHAQTMAFVVLSVSQLFHSLNLRHPERSIFKLGLFSNKYLAGAIVLGIFLQVIVITVPALASIFKVYPLSLRDWAFVGILSIMPLIVNEIAKIFIRAKK